MVDMIDSYEKAYIEDSKLECAFATFKVFKSWFL